MRSVLACMVYAPAVLATGAIDKGEDGLLYYPMPAKWAFIFILPVFAIFLMACVHFWTSKVEPLFARATKILEEYATGKTGRSGERSPLQQPVTNGAGKRSVTYVL